MPPKSKRRSELCKLCIQDLKTNEDVVVFGTLPSTRPQILCAGVTTSHYKISNHSSLLTFTCLQCSQEDSAAEINHLKAELESIKQTVVQVEVVCRVGEHQHH